MQSEEHVIYMVVGRQGPGRPKITWKKLTKNDCREWKLLTAKKGTPGDQVPWL